MTAEEKRLAAVVDHLVPFAKEMLKKRGEFHPFGACVEPDGRVAAVGAQLSTEHPDPDEVLDWLFAVFREMAAARSLQAVGVCYDSTITSPANNRRTRAIHIVVEHATGKAVDLFFPYRKKLLGGYTFDDPFALPGVGRVFQPVA